MDIVKKMNEQEKIVAAICHGPWMCISADILKGKKATSFFSIKVDMLQNEYVGLDVRTEGTFREKLASLPLPSVCVVDVSQLEILRSVEFQDVIIDRRKKDKRQSLRRYFRGNEKIPQMMIRMN